MSRGWLLGEGIFETMVWRDGRVEALGRHWQRLCAGAAALGLPAPDLNAMREALHAVVAANEGCHRLRYTLSRAVGDAVDICAAATPLTVWPETERVMLSPWQRNTTGVLTGIKSVSYAENVLALRSAHEQGCGEALLANTKDELCEGTGSNVFVVLDGRIFTPTLRSGCLAGVTRALVVESGMVEEKDLPVECLREVSEMFLTSSTRGVQAVAMVDGRPLSVVNGVLTQAARVLLHSALAVE